ncbi:branched-chain amino acid ABC transporter permease [Comamonadaceae bacterium OH3737_COT-264]|nr:branched-chain amino acid ABC transporter permease [Comamonadaceae bacterium OH3737_COT-264]
MFYRENGQFKSSYRADQQIFPVAQDRWAILLIVAAAFILVPMVASDYFYKAVLIPFVIMALAAVGLNILVGYCGQISLGTGAFMAAGAYAAFNLQARIDGMPLILALLGGGVVSMLFGMLVGIPSLRIRGLYLAVATLAAQFFMDWLSSRAAWITNHSSSGSVSAGDLHILGWAIDTPMEKYLLCLGFLCVLGLLAKNLVRSAVGREWMAIRDMDVAASVIGIRPTYAKLSAFAVSSFIVGVAGALWGFVHLGAWEPSAFNLDMSFRLLFMIIIGGLGSIVGGLFGAAFFVMLPLLLNYLPHWLGIPLSTAAATYLEHMIFGALIVFFLIVEPHGLARLWSTARQKLRVWPFPH